MFLTLLLAFLPVNPIDDVVLAPHVLDSAQHATLGLQAAEGTETHTIFHPTRAECHYANGAVMTAFRDTLYCMWQSSPTDEDSNDTWVAYSRSTDGGQTWTPPQPLALPNDTAYCTSGGWIATADTLVAFIDVWPKRLNPARGGYTYYMISTDGHAWSLPQPVTMADGSTMNGVMEQDPLTLHCGRIVGASHFQPGLHVSPVYTDAPLGTSGWHKGLMESEDRGQQSRELEPSLFVRRDGTLVMLFRDQQSSFRKLASVSLDHGATWTKPALTNIPDARTKQSAGQLPDGSIFLAANPAAAKRRYPLALLLSDDGITFSHAFLLRSQTDLPAQRYPGKAKTLGYNYPKSFVYNGWLYVVYTTNKEDVELTRVPISTIMHSAKK